MRSPSTIRLCRINPDHPVKEVTGTGRRRTALSALAGFAAYKYLATTVWQQVGRCRSPTERVEYAGQALTAFANGSISQIYCDPIDPNLDVMGWYCGNTGGLPDGWTRPVAQKLPNAWGLYDMHGNLYEWCNDWYGTYGEVVTDPVGPQTGGGRLVRGGDWSDYAPVCRSAYRDLGSLGVAYEVVGFRTVRSAD
jgi:formylglycine-generating enzyme required for sulfatase activity